ncbi:MAG TPA: 16S rRNA (cytidine(1402)-2'-O)-methyltransferase, partial [Acidobacteriaceae bacterium]|nr:16S rRNA (cytidine(1402)-2'-O)-methyltransferase [Acidobacteriaceae bacterium]
RAVSSADGQTLAPGLYLVATPIGNLEDITLRALSVLRSADRIACEDTRQTAKLLNHFGIQRPMVSYHLHNEAGRSEELVEAVRGGARIALVSDAGMPGIADPGEAIVKAAIAAGVAVYPVPGANAALSALVASGLSTERFIFHGFLPSKAGQRRTALERVFEGLRADGSAGTQVFYETPHRIVEALEDVAAVFGPEQRVVLARELTKLHEEFLRGTAASVLEELRSRPVVRGEMVLLVEGAVSGAGVEGLTVAEAVAALVREGASEKDALKQVAKARGLGKSEVYREWQRGRKG